MGLFYPEKVRKGKKEIEEKQFEGDFSYIIGL